MPKGRKAKLTGPLVTIVALVAQVACSHSVDRRFVSLDRETADKHWKNYLIQGFVGSKTVIQVADGQEIGEAISLSAEACGRTTLDSNQIAVFRAGNAELLAVARKKKIAKPKGLLRCGWNPAAGCIEGVTAFDISKPLYSEEVFICRAEGDWLVFIRVTPQRDLVVS